MLQRRGCTPPGGPPLRRLLLPAMPGLTETSRSLCFPSSEKIESHRWLTIKLTELMSQENEGVEGMGRQHGVFFLVGEDVM